MAREKTKGRPRKAWPPAFTPVDGQAMRRCPRCEETYPLTDEFFYANHLGNHLMHGECRGCGRERRRKHYRKNRDRIRAIDSKSPGARFQQIRQGAKARGIEWDLLRSEVFNLLASPCAYCGSANANGIDRLNNDRGYTAANAVPACGTCNIMKNTMATGEWMDHMRRVLLHLDSQE